MIFGRFELPIGRWYLDQNSYITGQFATKYTQCLVWNACIWHYCHARRWLFIRTRQQTTWKAAEQHCLYIGAISAGWWWRWRAVSLSCSVCRFQRWGCGQSCHCATVFTVLTFSLLPSCVMWTKIQGREVYNICTRQELPSIWIHFFTFSFVLSSCCYHNSWSTTGAHKVEQRVVPADFPQINLWLFPREICITCIIDLKHHSSLVFVLVSCLWASFLPNMMCCSPALAIRVFCLRNKCGRRGVGWGNPRVRWEYWLHPGHSLRCSVLSPYWRVLPQPSPRKFFFIL